jgi:hypothetical protein
MTRILRCAFLLDPSYGLKSIPVPARPLPDPLSALPFADSKLPRHPRAERLLQFADPFCGASKNTFPISFSVFPRNRPSHRIHGRDLPLYETVRRSRFFSPVSLISISATPNQRATFHDISHSRFMPEYSRCHHSNSSPRNSPLCPGNTSLRGSHSECAAGLT